MNKSSVFVFVLTGVVFISLRTSALGEIKKPQRINIEAANISTDESVKYDYPIVYVRSPRWVEDRGNKRPARWAEFGHPFAVTPNSDLVLLHPDGSEDVLVQGGKGSVTDPMVSFDGQWVYYAKFHD